MCESPDLYYRQVIQLMDLIPGHDVTIGKKLSSINPQQSNYLWGTAELFKWKTYKGKECRQALYTNLKILTQRKNIR